MILNKALDNLDDVSLIKNVVESECSDSLEVLVGRHTGICCQVGQKYFSHPQVTPYQSQDIIDHKHEIIYKAAKSYDPELGWKFVSWVGHHMRYYCLRSLKKDEKYQNVLTKNKYTNHSNPEEDSLLDHFVNSNMRVEPVLPFEDENTARLEKIKNLLDNFKDKRIRETIQIRYFSGSDKPVTYRKLAKIMKVSSQTIKNWDDDFIKYAKSKNCSKILEFIK